MKQQGLHPSCMCISFLPRFLLWAGEAYSTGDIFPFYYFGLLGMHGNTNGRLRHIAQCPFQTQSVLKIKLCFTKEEQSRFEIADATTLPIQTL